MQVGPVDASYAQPPDKHLFCVVTGLAFGVLAIEAIDDHDGLGRNPDFLADFPQNAFFRVFPVFQASARQLSLFCI